MTEQQAKINAVIFDMDGVLFNTERLAVDGWQLAGKAFGVAITEELVLSTVGRTLRDTFTILENALGAGIDYAAIRQHRIRYAEEYITRHGIPVKYGVEEILDVLTEYGIKRAVATSTERVRAENFLARANILNRFDAVICGDDVTRGKPAPDIFLHAAAQLGVKPEHCIVLEDSASGIQAAANAGMLPMLIPDLVQPSAAISALAANVFADLHEAASYISDLLRKQV